MANPEYYRRQSELCLQLALLYDDQRMTLWLVDLAKELQAKAGGAGSDAPEGEPRAMPDMLLGSEGGSTGLA
jgi:hypothetical protein